MAQAVKFYSLDEFLKLLYLTKTSNLLEATDKHNDIQLYQVPIHLNINTLVAIDSHCISR
jgi:hypothetical protein